jgi:aldehyde dehydrogenase
MCAGIHHPRSLPLPQQYDNFIGGKWVAPVGRPLFRQRLAHHRQALLQGGAVRRRPTSTWPWTPPTPHRPWGKTSVAERSNILLKIADRMEQNLELLAIAETIDNGKPLRETMAADIPLGIDHFRYFAGCIRAQEGTISEIDANHRGLPLP